MYKVMAGWGCCAPGLATTGCDLTGIRRHPDKLALLPQNGRCRASSARRKSWHSWRKRRQTSWSRRPVRRMGLHRHCSFCGRWAHSYSRAPLPGCLRDFDVSSLVVDEITLVGSRCGPFDKALAALESHAVDVRPLITASYSLNDGIKGIRPHAGRKGVIKVLIAPDRR